MARKGKTIGKQSPRGVAAKKPKEMRSVPRLHPAKRRLSLGAIFGILVIFGTTALNIPVRSDERLPSWTQQNPVVSPANWETYVSATHLFRISYPPDWSVDSEGDAATLLTFRAPTGESETLRIVESPLSLEEWTARYTQHPFYRASPLTIAGRNAMLIRHTKLDISTIVLQRGKIFVFETQGLLLQSGILSTINFIDFSYDQWTAFHDPAHHFYLTHPKDWTTETRTDTNADVGESTTIIFSSPPEPSHAPETIVLYPNGINDPVSLANVETSLVQLGERNAIWYHQKEGEKQQERCWYEFPSAPAVGWTARGSMSPYTNWVDVPCDPSPTVQHLLSTLYFYR